jgi:hypothetical protein
VQAYSLGLHMHFLQQTHRYTGAFAGHFRPGSVLDEIGPYHLVNMTVRQVLNKIVADSQGAIWIALRPEPVFTPQSLSSPFWSIIEHGEQKNVARSALKRAISRELEPLPGRSQPLVMSPKAQDISCSVPTSVQLAGNVSSGWASCGANSAGYQRNVVLQVVDQNGQPYQQQLQSLADYITVSSQNNTLGLPTTFSSSLDTSGSGTNAWYDTYYDCSSYCYPNMPAGNRTLCRVGWQTARSR